MDRSTEYIRNADTSLGELLVKAGACSPEKLQSSLLYQRRHPELKLGECMVALGVVTQPTVDLILAQQAAVRSGTVHDTLRLYDAMGRASRSIQRSVAVLSERMRSAHA